ncbi:hypothetical protein RND81_06G026300 [Saponaria officinalis]|uniref:Uncharacterized protein n=1 Tax=Saponaria officinalis TaxID=3572 RepID=A0AAW1K6Y6_SAPOF
MPNIICPYIYIYWPLKFVIQYITKSNIQHKVKLFGWKMADIAMLVAEEYERRIKMAKKKANEGKDAVTRDMVLPSSSSPLYGFKIKWINQTNVLSAGVEPGTHMGWAVVDGFFSA